MNPLLILQILQLIPALAKAIKELVEVFERPGHGDQKRQAVMRQVETTLSACDLPDDAKQTLRQVAAQMIEDEVALRNAEKPSPELDSHIMLQDGTMYALRDGETLTMMETPPQGYSFHEPTLFTKSGMRVVKRVEQ